MTLDGSETVGMHHNMEVPEDCTQFLCFTIVRNPYDRAYSEWCRYQNPIETPIKPGRKPIWKDVPFLDFCRGISIHPNTYPNMCSLLGTT